MKRGVAVVLIVILLAVIGFHRITISPVKGATSPTLLIPLYSPPNCQWNAIISMKNTYPANVIVIVNVNNGPGSQENSTYLTYIQKLQDAGILVLGYVWTNYGSRSITDVEADIDNWISWYHVNGIFFDGVSTSSSGESYYSSLVQYLKGKSSSYIAIGNPGTYSPTTVSDYVGIFDVLVIYDNSGYPSSWPANLNSSKLGALVYGVPSFDPTAFQNLLSKAKYVYVTDDDGTNPWDQLSSYVADEAAILANVPKVNYVLGIESANTSTYSIGEHYPAFSLSNGEYNVTYSVFIKNWDSTGAGVYPMYVVFNDSTGSQVSASFYWGSGYSGVALYACYNSDCIDTDINPTAGWVNLSIVATQTSVQFYANGIEVKEVSGLSLDSALRVDAGSWDNTAVYQMYIDNVSETEGTQRFRESFDCDYNCYFTVHVGDVSVVNGDVTKVPFFDSRLIVVLVTLALILRMRK